MGALASPESDRRPPTRATSSDVADSESGPTRTRLRVGGQNPSPTRSGPAVTARFINGAMWGHGLGPRAHGTPGSLVTCSRLADSEQTVPQEPLRRMLVASVCLYTVRRHGSPTWHLLRHLIRQRLVLILVGHIGPVVRLDQRVVTAASACYLRQTHRSTDLDIAESRYTSGCTRTHDCSAGRRLRRI